MATTEEVDILVKTVGDTTGAQQVAQALQQTQQVANQTQAQLSAQQQFANQVLRQSMAQVPQTLEAFRGQLEAVNKQVGARPTLKPEDFGISAASTQQVTAAAQAQTRATDAAQTSLARATVGVAEHTDAQREMRQGFELTTDEVVRFGASALGIGASLSLATTAGHLLRDALVEITTQALAADQATRNLTAAFGAAATGWQQYAQTASRSSGFAATDIESATLALRPLAEQLHLTQTQFEGLADSAQTLATIHDIPLTDAANALAAAMQGSSAAADALGLSLSDQQVALRAANGAYQQNFQTLTPLQQGMVRYEEALRQVNVQEANLATSGPSVSQRFRELGTSVSNLNTQLGQGPLNALLTALELLSRGFAGTSLAADDTRKHIDALVANPALQTLTAQQRQQIANFQPALAPPSLPGPTPQIEGPQAFGGPVAPEVIAQAQQALGQLRSSIQDVGTATDAQIASLARHEAAVAALNAAVARQAADSVGQVTNALQVALERTTDPAEHARLQAELDSIDSIATAEQALLQAQQQQNQLRYDAVQLSGQEAEIRLSMLPAQERMLELQNQVNQKQIEATQRSLPAQRALQDLQNAIQEQTLIAQSPDRTLGERSAALRRATELQRGIPEASLAAQRAQTAALPASRAVQDVNAAAQLQGLQQQQALQGLEYARQQVGFLQQIAEASTASSQRNVNYAVNVSPTLNVNGPNITQDDLNQITSMSADAILQGFHQAVQTANNRTTGSALIGSTP